jgi:hypothetical protein
MFVRHAIFEAPQCMMHEAKFYVAMGRTPGRDGDFSIKPTSADQRTR